MCLVLAQHQKIGEILPFKQPSKLVKICSLFLFVVTCTGGVAALSNISIFYDNRTLLTVISAVGCLPWYYCYLSDIDYKVLRYLVEPGSCFGFKLRLIFISIFLVCLSSMWQDIRLLFIWIIMAPGYFISCCYDGVVDPWTRKAIVFLAFPSVLGLMVLIYVGLLFDYIDLTYSALTIKQKDGTDYDSISNLAEAITASYTLIILYLEMIVTSMFDPKSTILLTGPVFWFESTSSLSRSAGM